jgi:hypothetical protein
MSNTRKGLKAWVRYDGNNNAVAGSLIFQKSKPKVGKWREYKDVNLCCLTSDCVVDYGPWRLVSGGEAGDGKVLVDDLEDQEFTFIGPNDDDNDGWVYLTRRFSTDVCLEIEYQYSTFDGANFDYPIYWTSVTQPTGEPDDTTSRVMGDPESGTWTVSVPAGEWFAIGLYSTDSCCGRGFLEIEISENSGICSTTTTTTI